MDSSRWQAVEALFLEAEALSGEARQRFLEAAGTDDPELRREVEELLAADTDIERHVAAAIDGTLQRDEPGDGFLRIERYEVLGELGRGGMGTVFLARRDDDQYRMQVAIKVARNGVYHDDVRRRMRQERHILAGLDHPNICKLLDGGTTDQGMPYFVMEHIEGEPIDAYCDRHDLSVEARLELFRQVCDAIHYAHRQLVIHRDLKPSNILVTREGIPKLLDFGIAKLLDPATADGSVAVTTPLITRSGMRLLTPAYASPEQIRGQTLSTASDVYSLGVLLFLLLTGRYPYAIERASPSELEHLICEREPDLASAVLTREAAAAENAQRQPLLRRAKRIVGDLDNIVAMALRKEPETRYASVNQLADDIHRHLIGDMVRARPHTLRYRAGKFIRRHRASVASLALIILSLTVGLGLALWQARVAAFERRQAEIQRELAEKNLRRAEAEQVRAEAAIEFTIGVFEVSNPSEARGNSVTVREMLDPAVDRIRRDLKPYSRDRADMLDTFGRAYQGLGLYNQSEDLLQEALAIRQTDAGLDLANSENHLGELRLAQDRIEDAETLFRRSLSTRQEKVGTWHPAVVESWINIGVALTRQGRLAEAENAYAMALQIQELLLPPDHEDFIESFSNMAAVLWLQNDPLGAEDLYHRALVLARQHRGDNHPRTVDILANLTTVLHSQGKFAAARPLAEQTLAARRSLFDGDHPSVGQSLNTLAVVLYELGDLAAAEPLQRQAIAIKTTKLGPTHRSTLSSRNNLGQLLMAQGAYLQAMVLYEDVVRLRRTGLGKDHPRVRRDLGHLAEAHLLAGNPDAASSAYLDALSGPGEAVDDPAQHAVGLAALVAARLKTAHHDAEAASLQHALLALDALPDAQPWQVVRIHGTAFAHGLITSDDAAARHHWEQITPWIDGWTPPSGPVPPRDRLAMAYLRALVSDLERPDWLDASTAANALFSNRPED